MRSVAALEGCVRAHQRPCFAAAVAFMCLATAAAAGNVELLGRASIPGDARDRSGLEETLAQDVPQNILGSFGSGLAWTGADDLYLAVDDRGPKNGEVTFRARVEKFRISVDPGAPEPLRVALVDTILLRNPDTRPYVGISTAIDLNHPEESMRLDPEAISITHTGSFWTSDEYGPWLDEWSADGIHLRRLQPPVKFRCEHPAAKAEQELPPHNSSGRQPNRGFEGMTLSSDGERILAILQSPLIQDGALAASGKRIGRNLRIVEMSLSEAGAEAAPREFVYQLDDASLGVNEMIAVGADSYLVIERDGKAGKEAATRRIWRIELRGATDVSAMPALPSAELPPEVTPVKKSLLIDLMDPKFGLAGAEMPEKIEGLALGPTLPDGRRLLLVSTDNDCIPTVPSWFWAFAIDPADLAPSPAPAAPSPPSAPPPSR